MAYGQVPIVLPPSTPVIISALTNAAQTVALAASSTGAPAPTQGRQLRRIWCTSTAAAVSYVQLFNNVIANVTLGTTVPNDVLPVPAGGTNGWAMPSGDSYPLGIAAAATTTWNGSTAPSAALVCEFSVF